METYCLEAGFALRCFQRLSVTDVSYSAVRLAAQQIHRWSARPGPLVLGADPLKSPTPTVDRTRPVSRRSIPSSQTPFMDEKSNPWDLLQPQDGMSRQRGATSRRRWDLSGEVSPVFPGSLYPLSDGPPTRYHRVDKPCFRTCSSRRSHSQAALSLCKSLPDFQPG